MDAAVPASCFGKPMLPYSSVKPCPRVQISPPMTKAQMQSFHSGDLGHSSFTIFAYCFWVISIPPENRMPFFRKNTRKEI